EVGMKAAIAACAALGLFVFAAAEADDERRGETATHLQEGKAAYAHWCAPCHAASPGLAGTLALGAKYQGAIPAALEDRTDLTPEVVRHFVRNGIAWMPPF